jgi:hypothetical protein
MSATRKVRSKFAPTAASFAAMGAAQRLRHHQRVLPRGEAKEAAKEFVEKVIGDDMRAPSRSHRKQAEDKAGRWRRHGQPAVSASIR